MLLFWLYLLPLVLCLIVGFAFTWFVNAKGERTVTKYDIASVVGAAVFPLVNIAAVAVTAIYAFEEFKNRLGDDVVFSDKTDESK